MSRSDAGLPRIAVASSGLGHIARGVEAWAGDLASALARRGVDVTLFKGAGTAGAAYERVIPCWRRDSVRARRASRALPNFLAWRLGVASPYGVEQITFAWGLLRSLRRERIDILHVQDPLVALLAERARRVGLIRTRTILAHGTEEPAEFLARLTHVQHLAPEHARVCRESGVWRREWTVIPNFIDTGRFCPGKDAGLRAELGIPGDAVVVLTAAAIKRTHKRIDHLLAEFAALRASHPEVPAYLVIAGGEEPQTRELVEEGTRLLGDRVRFLVRFPRERMGALYRAADVFVLTSLKEMMPIAVLEAAASGLPCIVHGHPVLEWITGPGGHVVDMAKTGGLAAAMGELSRDAGLRARLGAAARERCVEKFGEEEVVGKIMESYGAILGRPVVAGAARPASVSVVIPAYNCGRWVAQAVQSALDQTTPAHEVIVVDDGSTDDTRERLAPFGGRIRYERQANAGVASARNRGLSLATGELVAFLDADDAWHPRKLEMQLGAMAENPGLGLLGTRVFDCEGRAPEIGARGETTLVARERLGVKNYLTTSSIVVRREVARRVGEFDTALHGPEDHDYWLRAADVAPVGILELPLTGYRTVPGSLSRRASSMEAGMRRILAKLDRRDFWRGDRLLRRRAYGYVAYSSAFLHGADGDHRTALRRVFESLAWYPLPLSRSEAGVACVRLRRVAVLALRCLGILGPERAV